MSVITNTEQKARDIPFWDSARPGELCAVPCWPEDQNGDAIDCKSLNVLVGVLDESGIFRAEDAPAFNPNRTIWVCGKERGRFMSKAQFTLAPTPLSQ